MIIRAVLMVLALALPARAEVSVQVVTSPGGIEAWLVESPGIPFVALELRFAGGALLDVDGREGAVSLMAGLLEEGTGDLDAQGFAAARQDLAAEMRFSAGQETVSVSARFLTENRDAAVDLLRRALVEPAFDPAAIERVRGQAIAGVRADARDPSAIASRIFDGLAFVDHPLARPTDGTEETLAALTRDDILEAHGAALTRDRVFVGAVGDIDAATLADLLDTLLGGLPEAGPALPRLAEMAAEGGITLEPFPGPQSVILFGHGAIGRDDPDFSAAFVANEVFGGGRFSARLMREVRDRRGLTYGIGTGLQITDSMQLLVGQVQVANASVAETIAVIRDEWRRIAEEGLTEAELEGIITWLTGAYPLRFDGNATIARALVGLQMQGYPSDYPSIRNDLIRAVTLEDANRAARRLFDPEQLRFVVVGNPEPLPE